MTQDKGEVRFLKIGNLTFSGALDFSKENAYIDSGTHNSGVYARSRVYPDDVLMNRVGTPLGKVSVIPTDLEHSNVNSSVFALGFKGISAMRSALPTVRHLSARLATTNFYFGNPTRSQCEVFGVSQTAMAIRIEELPLINSE